MTTKQLSEYSRNIGYFVATEFGPNFFRFGMTKNGRSPYQRWAEDPDYRKCGNPANFEHEFYELGDKLDHDIHNLLKKCPDIRVASPDVVRSPEVFECDLGLEYAKNLVENFIGVVVGKASPIRKPLDPRPYQQAFVDQFKATKGDFLLFAKCRSGKSAMTLLAATESDYRSVLVVSYRTSAANSWRDDASSYTRFSEWDVIDLSDKSWQDKIAKSRGANRRQLLVSTVQRQNEKFSYVGKLSTLYSDGIDLLALDECHIGGFSDQFKKLRKSISYGRLLEISGTAFKACWNYPSENTYVWGYVEEQRAKAQGYEWAQKLPKMELVLAKYDGAESAKIYEDSPDALKNVFTVIDGKWQDPGSVAAFLDKFFAYGKVNKKHKMLHNSNHIVMTLPSVESCNLFAQTLQAYGSPFVPMVITGDSGNNQADILEHARTHGKTICLTRWANVVGVTIPQWDTVIHGCEYQSAEFWVQFAFRGGSTKGESWRVIDFAPQRAVQSILEMVTVTANVSQEVDPKSALQSFLDFADIFEFNNGYESINYESILKMASSSVSSAKAAINSAAAAITVGQNIEMMRWLFDGKDRVENLVQIREQINGNDTNGRGNKFVERNGSRSTDSKELRILLEQIKAAIQKIDDVILFELKGNNPISSLPQLLEAESFELLTDCHPDTIRTAIDSGWVCERAIADATSQAHLYLSNLVAQLDHV